MPDYTNYIQIVGWFTSNERAAGVVLFGEYEGCGNGGTNWSATKH